MIIVKPFTLKRNRTAEAADFLLALANSLTFFGGVPQAIVPDNLKSAVIKTHPYEPDLNQSTEDFASHYQTVIYPARSRKPKDKALVERTVGILYSRVYAMLEGQVFFSLGSLNEAIFQKVNDHNLKPFQGRIDSRQNRFDELERITLIPLPTTRYELKHFKTAKVQQNCHVILGEDKHYYSVPFRYIGKYVMLSYTSESIEIYFEYKRIAIHARFRAKHQYTTLKEHLPEKHQWIMNWSGTHSLRNSLLNKPKRWEKIPSKPLNSSFVLVNIQNKPTSGTPPDLMRVCLLW